jgi:hypothetical protein
MRPRATSSIVGSVGSRRMSERRVLTVSWYFTKRWTPISDALNRVAVPVFYV